MGIGYSDGTYHEGEMDRYVSDYTLDSDGTFRKENKNEPEPDLKNAISADSLGLGKPVNWSPEQNQTVKDIHQQLLTPGAPITKFSDEEIDTLSAKPLLEGMAKIHLKQEAVAKWKASKNVVDRRNEPTPPDNEYVNDPDYGSTEPIPDFVQPKSLEEQAGLGDLIKSDKLEAYERYTRELKDFPLDPNFPITNLPKGKNRPRIPKFTDLEMEERTAGVKNDIPWHSLNPDQQTYMRGQASKILGDPEIKTKDELQNLIEEEGGVVRLSPYHKGVREFLKSYDPKEYEVYDLDEFKQGPRSGTIYIRKKPALRDLTSFMDLDTDQFIDLSGIKMNQEELAKWRRSKNVEDRRNEPEVTEEEVFQKNNTWANAFKALREGVPRKLKQDYESMLGKLGIDVADKGSLEAQAGLNDINYGNYYKRK